MWQAMKSKTIVLGLVVMVLMAGNALACGPFFDDAYLVRGSEQEFLSMPEGSFQYELEKISGIKKDRPKREDMDYDAIRQKTADVDVTDLKDALRAFEIPKEQKDKALSAYTSKRARITDHLKNDKVVNWNWYGDHFRSHERAEKKPKMIMEPDTALLKLIPKEFKLYTDGAVIYHNDDFVSAINIWEELLRLPAAQRRYKSVWAAFMIGKAYLSIHKDKESIPYFEMARQLVDEGYKDSLNLSKESYGWQALAEYETGQYAIAIKRYLKQMDEESLYRMCRTIADLNDVEFENVVKDETALRVLIGWVVSHSSYYFYSNDENTDYIRIATRLTTDIEKNGLKISSDNADRVAWMFYNLGKFDKADSWLKISKERSALAQWIRAKLLIREGKVDKAIEKMRSLKHAFAQDKEFNRFYGKINADVERKIDTEHSILLMSRKEYMMAFGILLQGAYWEDIAYIAEKVLTKEELENYLNTASNANFGKIQTLEGMESRYDDSKPKDENPGIWIYYSANLEKPTLKSALYYLLARRYARDGQWDKAFKYMPAAFITRWQEGKPNAQGYMDYVEKSKTINLKYMLFKLKSSLAKAEDASLPARQRADDYYKAALITRQYGMELIGTELDPDGFVFGGGFDYNDSLITRFAIMDKDAEVNYNAWFKEYIDKTKARREEIKKNRKFIDGSQDEEERALGSLPTPFKRFHYRYKAADLMWKCAELLPNNDELKAKALCLGGTYLKNREPKEADRFYKELVKTCGKTELGKAANKLKWFPKMKED
jgi:hypothetical protein